MAQKRTLAHDRRKTRAKVEAEAPLITAREMSRIGRISLALAYEIVREGEVPIIRRGNRAYVRRGDFLRWLEGGGLERGAA